MPVIRNFFLNKTFIFILYLVFALVASIQSLVLTKRYQEEGNKYTHYNNYVIFVNSFQHLKEGKDLYILYPEEQADLYKYSPAFALFFGIFASLPDAIGLTLWNICNSLVLAFAVFCLPRLDSKQKALILITVVVEQMTSIQNQQSNALIAGLILFAFCFLEEEKYFLAALALTATVFIKLFGLAAFCLFLFYPRKGKLLVYTAICFLIFLFIPLLFVNYQQLKLLYLSWKNLLAQDHSISYGLSVMGWLKSWFGLEVNKTLVTLAGILLFCIPLVQWKKYGDYNFRLLILSSVLIWVVIFNHKAESPSFVIAMSGVAIWFYTRPYHFGNLVLLLLAVIFTSLSVTDLFPRTWDFDYCVPYVLKVVPCIFIWVKILYDSLFNSRPAVLVGPV